MKGLELCRAYYEQFGAEMIRENFPEYEGLIAVGLIGDGSECLGYDDEISRDHDFEPGFCMFLPDESLVDSRTEFRLERAYAQLPREFMGVQRLRTAPVGGSRHGVVRIRDFLAYRLGMPRLPQSYDEWFGIPDYSLAQLCGGEVFRDDFGELTSIRHALASPPVDVRRKKLAGRLVLMAQAGQYNYGRCLRRGDEYAAQLAAIEFFNSAIAAVFLLEGRYMPYYKWQFRALSELSDFGRRLATMFGFLLTTGNDASVSRDKLRTIEDISRAIVERLRLEGFSALEGTDDLERHAYAVNDGIADPDLRNKNIFYAV